MVCSLLARFLRLGLLDWDNRGGTAGPALCQATLDFDDLEFELLEAVAAGGFSGVGATGCNGRKQVSQRQVGRLDPSKSIVATHLRRTRPVGIVDIAIYLLGNRGATRGWVRASLVTDHRPRPPTADGGPPTSQSFLKVTFPVGQSFAFY